MKKNRLAFILILVMIGFAAILVWQNRSKTTLSNKETAFAVRDTASITKIFIADLDTADVLLERTPQGWIANKEYKAHNRKVELLLETMMKLRVRSPVFGSQPRQCSKTHGRYFRQGRNLPDGASH